MLSFDLIFSYFSFDLIFSYFFVIFFFPWSCLISHSLIYTILLTWRLRYTLPYYLKSFRHLTWNCPLLISAPCLPAETMKLSKTPFFMYPINAGNFYHLHISGFSPLLSIFTIIVQDLKAFPLDDYSCS